MSHLNPGKQRRSQDCAMLEGYGVCVPGVEMTMTPDGPLVSLDEHKDYDIQLRNLHDTRCDTEVWVGDHYQGLYDFLFIMCLIFKTILPTLLNCFSNWK